MVTNCSGLSPCPAHSPWTHPGGAPVDDFYVLCLFTWEHRSGHVNKLVGKLNARWKLMLRSDPQLKREKSWWMSIQSPCWCCAGHSLSEGSEKIGPPVHSSSLLFTDTFHPFSSLTSHFTLLPEITCKTNFYQNLDLGVYPKTPVQQSCFWGHSISSQSCMGAAGTSRYPQTGFFVHVHYSAGSSRCHGLELVFHGTWFHLKWAFLILPPA